jgi:myo-inositol-1(or 4)-monophosphatase
MNVMVSSAFKAAKKLRRDFSEIEHLQVSKKSPAKFVANAEAQAEEILIEELERARPHYGLLSQKRGSIEPEGCNTRWIIAPLEGKTNFLHAIPHFCISIAVEDQGQIKAGVIYDPIKEELFWAENGDGAWVNENRLRVSNRNDLGDSLIGTLSPNKNKGDKELFMAEVNDLMPLVAGLRHNGSAALDLAYVAAGRYDGAYQHNLKPWDIAAAIILVREAGGYVSETDGRSNMMDTGDILATNGELQTAVEKILRATKRNLPKSA